MKTPVVIVSVSLTIAIVLVAMLLIITQTRRQPVSYAPATTRLKIEAVKIGTATEGLRPSPAAN